MTECRYCGCRVEDHDPVYVEREVDGQRVPAGAFCNYGCLGAHVEREGLATGTACRLDGR